MRESRAPRRRFLLLVLVVAICAVVSRTHIRSVGHHLEYRLDEFAGERITEQDVVPMPEDMVDVVSVTYDGDVPIVTFEASHEGDGMALVNLEGQGMMFALSVKPGMVVVVDEFNFTGWEVIGWSLVACFGTAFAVSLWNLLWFWKRSRYGYEMAANAGFALFSAAQTIVFLQAMLSAKTRDFVDLAMLITQIADRFVWLSLVPMAVAALLVSVSNVALVRHEGRGLTNMLGIAASLAWAGACVAWRLLARLDYTTMNEFYVNLGINSVVATGISFCIALLLGTSLCSWLAAKHVPSQPRDYLMILGCGLRADGTPTPLLAGRVDAARAYARAQEEAGGVAPVFVPSGGQGPDEIVSEAASMRHYLEEHGVDARRIIAEEQSTTTRENFTCSSALIAADWESRPHQGDAPRVAFSTTNYHVFRSYVFAREAGLDAEGIAAPTKHYFWPNAFLREFVALLAAYPVGLFLAFLLIALVYGAAEYIMLMG